MGGIAAYSSTSTIRNCITDVNLTCDTAGISTAIVSQSPIVGYINAVTLEGNVAYGGIMTAAGDITARGAGGLYGTIAASSGRNIFSDNLTCEEVTIDGNAVTAGEQNGDLTGKEALQTKETYIDLGWRFDLEWEMTADKYPIPRPFSYPDEAITRVTAAPAGDGIGFSWYSKEEGDSYVSISTKEDMSSPQTIAASGHPMKPDSGIQLKQRAWTRIRLIIIRYAQGAMFRRPVHSGRRLKAERLPLSIWQGQTAAI